MNQRPIYSHDIMFGESLCIFGLVSWKNHITSERGVVGRSIDMFPIRERNDERMSEWMKTSRFCATDGYRV